MELGIEACGVDDAFAIRVFAFEKDFCCLGIAGCRGSNAHSILEPGGDIGTKSL